MARLRTPCCAVALLMLSGRTVSFRSESTVPRAGFLGPGFLGENLIQESPPHSKKTCTVKLSCRRPSTGTHTVPSVTTKFQGQFYHGDHTHSHGAGMHMRMLTTNFMRPDDEELVRKAEEEETEETTHSFWDTWGGPNTVERPTSSSAPTEPKESYWEEEPEEDEEEEQLEQHSFWDEFDARQSAAPVDVPPVYSLDDPPPSRPDYRSDPESDYDRAKLGAAELGEQLQPDHMQRHRYIVAPDEAFGAIFQWDAVFNNSNSLQRQAWAALAEEEGRTPPDDLHLVQMQGMRMDLAIERVLRWSTDWGDARRLAMRQAQLYYQQFQDTEFTVAPHIEPWLQILQEHSIGCVLVSQMDQASASQKVEASPIRSYFLDLVTAEDFDDDDPSEKYKAAAIKLKRPPEHCVSFETTPEGIRAASTSLTKTVGVLGSHARYQLQNADMIVGGVDELKVLHVRHLFAEAASPNDFRPQMEMQRETVKVDYWGNPIGGTRTITRERNSPGNAQ